MRVPTLPILLATLLLAPDAAVGGGAPPPAPPGAPGAGSAGLAAAAPAPAAPRPSWGWGRVSLFASYGRISPDSGESLSFQDYSANLSLRSREAEEGGFEFGLDARGARYTAGEGHDRFSLWDAWVGGRLAGGRLGVKVGQLWLTDLGALGSVGGLALEVRPKAAWKIGRPRVGVFGGLEPKGFDAGWESDTRKGGAYVALDGSGGRKHVLGWVLVRDRGLTQRSVVTLSNFFRVGQKLFVYQVGEYDLSTVGGGSGLRYLMVNARYAPVKRVEIQGLFNRGRSVDYRTLTQDQLDGRPISAAALQGLLYESAGGRVSVEALKGLRLWVGYSRDRNNSSDETNGRFTAGLHASNPFGSGLDLTISDSRVDGGSRTSDYWYASVGRSLGPKVYLSVDYSTSAAALRLSDANGGVTLVSRPEVKRYSISGLVHAGRRASVTLTLERTDDGESKEDRGLLGLIYRF